MAIAQQVINQKQQQQEQQHHHHHQNLLGLTNPLSLHPWNNNNNNNNTPVSSLPPLSFPPTDFTDPFQVGSGQETPDPTFHFPPPLDPHSTTFRFSDFDSDDWMDTLMAAADTQTQDFHLSPFPPTRPDSLLNRIFSYASPPFQSKSQHNNNHPLRNAKTTPPQPKRRRLLLLQTLF
jgi:hypothetical protein